ncbi:MAG: PilZ domain-containing protein [Candidatus Omnitrophota bacterium]
MDEQYTGSERRQFMRLDYVTPLDYKVCKKETITKLLQGYTSNVSKTGLLCTIKQRVEPEDILWLVFDRDILNVCQDIEKSSLVYQNGIIGKVVRVELKEDNTYRVGIHFITREEKSKTETEYIEKHFSIDKRQDEKT